MSERKAESEGCLRLQNHQDTQNRTEWPWWKRIKLGATRLLRQKTNPSSWNLIFESLFNWNFMSGNSSKIFGSNPCPLYGFIWPISWSPQWLALSSKSFSLLEQQLQIALIKLERAHKNQRKQAHDTVPSDTIKIRYMLSADDGQVPGKFFP